MATNQAAINFLAGEARMTRIQLKNLNDQIESFKAQREAAQYKLDALLAKLNELGGSEESGTQGRTSDAESSILGSGALVAPAARIDGQGVVTPSVRAAIREAIRSAPQGLNTREILASPAIRNVSVHYKAKVRLAVRVRNELTKMRKEGQIYKNDRGYFLSPKPTIGD